MAPKKKPEQPAYERYVQYYFMVSCMLYFINFLWIHKVNTRNRVERIVCDIF